MICVLVRFLAMPLVTPVHADVEDVDVDQAEATLTDLGTIDLILEPLTQPVVPVAEGSRSSKAIGFRVTGTCRRQTQPALLAPSPEAQSSDRRQDGRRAMKSELQFLSCR